MYVVHAYLERVAHDVAAFDMHLGGREIVALIVARELDDDDLPAGIGRDRPSGRRRSCGGARSASATGSGRVLPTAARGEDVERECGAKRGDRPRAAREGLDIRESWSEDGERVGWCVGY